MSREDTTIVVNYGDRTVAFDEFDTSNATTSIAPFGMQVAAVDYLDGPDRFYRSLVVMDNELVRRLLFFCKDDYSFCSIGEGYHTWDQKGYLSQAIKIPAQGGGTWIGGNRYAIYDDYGRGLFLTEFVDGGTMIRITKDGGRSWDDYAPVNPPGIGAPQHHGGKIPLYALHGAAIGHINNRLYIDALMSINWQPNSFYKTPEVAHYVWVSSDTRVPGELSWSVSLVPLVTGNGSDVGRGTIGKRGGLYVSYSGVRSARSVNGPWYSYPSASLPRQVANSDERGGLVAYGNSFCNLERKGQEIYMNIWDPESKEVIDSFLWTTIPSGIRANVLDIAYPSLTAGGLCVIKARSYVSTAPGGERNGKYIYSYNGGATWNIPHADRGEILFTKNTDSGDKFILGQYRGESSDSEHNMIYMTNNFSSYSSFEFNTDWDSDNAIIGYGRYPLAIHWGTLEYSFVQSKCHEVIQESENGRTWVTKYNATRYTLSEDYELPRFTFNNFAYSGNRVMAFPLFYSRKGWLESVAGGDFVMRNPPGSSIVENFYRLGLVDNLMSIGTAPNSGLSAAAAMFGSDYRSFLVFSPQFGSSFDIVTLPWPSAGYSTYLAGYDFSTDEFLGKSAGRILRSTDFRSFRTAEPLQVVGNSVNAYQGGTDGLFFYYSRPNAGIPFSLTVSDDGGVTFTSGGEVLSSNLMNVKHTRGILYSSTESFFRYTRDGLTEEVVDLRNLYSTSAYRGLAVRAPYHSEELWKIGSI